MRRWRATTLGAVYLLFVIHVVQWKLAGHTLAPLEFSEAMYTLELGIVTAGFLFMVVAFLATVVVGRFFCGWACHILALEDLSAYLLKKLGIRPKPVRSRVLLLVPPLVLFYMFVWPIVKRVLDGTAAPSLRIATDADGWASFVTKDLLRAMPGPGITALTFAVCGFADVYFLGSRSFCSYACPYGALLAIGERFAPGRIVAKGDCTGCGKCTAACETHISVHQELLQFGKIVNPSCLKAMDCVDACPEGNVVFGFAKPALFKSWRSLGRFGVPYDFTLAEDAVMAAVFLGTVAIYRGLYDSISFFLALAIGGILAYLAVLGFRLVRDPNIRLSPFQLRLKGSLRPAGRAFVGFLLVLMGFTAHSAFIRWHEWRGGAIHDEISAGIDRGVPADPERCAAARRHLESCEHFGLVRPLALERRLASLHLFREEQDAALPYVRRIVEREPDDFEWRITLAAILLTKSEVGEAVGNLEAVTRASEDGLRDDPRAAALRASAHEMLAQVRETQGDAAAAARELESAQRLRSLRRL
jgi:polyferredoxin